MILGGSQENTVLSCEGQARLGHEVHLAFGPIYGPEGSLLDRVQNFRTVDGRGITTHVVPHMIRDVNPVAEFRAYYELRNLIERLKPDIVHTHSSKAGVLGRLAAWNVRAGKGVRRPGIVHTIHGPPFMPLDGGPLNVLKRRLNNAIYTIAETIAANHCHRIVSVAGAMTQQFLARGIGSPDLFETVYSGMETSAFLHPAPGEDRVSMRRALGIGEQDFVIGTVARLAEHKGHDDLLDALGEEMKRDHRLKLVWVGDGWWADRLKQRIDALDLKDSVILTGLVPPQRVSGLIRAMDVLAHPSAREGLPRTVPQALLCNVCPVAYDVDGTGEACRDMETGRLVKFGDIEGLREAIVWLRDHPTERKTLASTGKAWCIERFSAEAMVSHLERVYDCAERIVE
jgi:glycosyltransferase involved in cell wall biosynthesis